MDKRIKRLVLLLSIGIFGLLLFGIISFIKAIRNERGCDFANIDNVEIYAKIDIPKIVTSDCNYNVSLNRKTVYFKLKELTATTYIKKNKLKQSNQLKESDFEKMKFFLGDITTIKANKDAIYDKTIKSEKSSSFVVYNSKTNELWVLIDYKD
jgi:hypothetical protein